MCTPHLRRATTPWCLAGIAAAVSALVFGCRSAPPPQLVEGGRLGQVRLYRPSGTPEGFAFVFSDRDGWTPALDAVAQRLAEGGLAVAGVDLPHYLQALAASDDGCHYVVAELEDFSQRRQRELGFGEYRSPIAAGIGAGGTLVYAALAQAPAATLAGALSVDPAPALPTRVPLCAGAPAHAAPGGGFRYGPKPDLPGWWRVSAPPGNDLAEAVERAKGTLEVHDGPPVERLAALLAAAADAGSVRDLPLVLLPASQPGPFMAVIYSGDGGWRDIDKQIGEILVREGVPVVGVDSLRYFWREKTPEETARDLAAILTRYGTSWGTPKAVLIGYSFGAGILPFAFNRLTEADRARIVQISLLGLEPRAVFEIHLSGWLGIAPSLDGPPVLPELQRIDLRLVQCFYGIEEEDTLCRAPELREAEIIRTSGGHHFDGDYPALARRILAGAHRRLASGG